jgi:DNA polymerase-3 subunit epsilon
MIPDLWQKWRRQRRMRRLKEPYKTLLSRDDGVLVSVDCETTSLKVKEAEILSIAAVCIDGNTLRARDAFYTLVKPQQTAPDQQNVAIHRLLPCETSEGLPLKEALQKFLWFIGGRTLLGYYLEYDLAVLNKYLRPMLGAALPNHEIEVSGHYYDWRFASYPGAHINLRWETMIKNLDLPVLPRHDAMNDALTAAMMYMTLQSRGYGASQTLVSSAIHQKKLIR